MAHPRNRPAVRFRRRTNDGEMAMDAAAEQLEGFDWEAFRERKSAESDFMAAMKANSEIRRERIREEDAAKERESEEVARILAGRLRAKVRYFKTDDSITASYDVRDATNASRDEVRRLITSELGLDSTVTLKVEHGIPVGLGWTSWEATLS